MRVRCPAFVLVAALVAVCMPACAAVTQVVAGDDDLADYRAFRAAAHEGSRLAFAQRYLELHPRGAWADEVRAAFGEEESTYFEAAKASSRAAFEYLVNLPRGPHAAAARAVIDSDSERAQRAAVAELVSRAHDLRLMLSDARARRRKIRERIFAEVALLLDARVYGVAPGLVPEPLLREFAGARTTIAWVVPRRHDELFFEVPSPSSLDQRASAMARGAIALGADSRVVTLDLELLTRDGVVASGRLSGADLFVSWAEADLARVLDPTDPGARADAAAHVAASMAGALEAVLPLETCAAPELESTKLDNGGTLLARHCGGWSARVGMGARAGTTDEITVTRAPSVPNSP